MPSAELSAERSQMWAVAEAAAGPRAAALRVCLWGMSARAKLEFVLAEAFGEPWGRDVGWAVAHGVMRMYRRRNSLLYDGSESDSEED